MIATVTLLDVVQQAMRDFERAGARVALVGGLAVGARARERARVAVRLIEERGYGRGKQLAAELEQQVARWASR